MGTPLTGSTVASTYTGLLKTADNAALTTTLKFLCDGAGNNSALQLSTTAVNITGNFTIGTNKLIVDPLTGNTTIAGTLNVTGATTLSGNLALPGTLSVTGATSLSSLSTSGAATIGTTLAVTGATTLASVGVTGAATIGTTLSVTGATTLSSVGITGAATVGTTFGVTGATSLSTLSTSGAATIGGTLGVTGATSLSSLSTSGAATIGGTLGVTGNATLSGNLSVNGNTTLGDTSGDSVAINAGTITAPNITNVPVDLTNDKVLITDASDASKVKTVNASSLGITASNAPQCVQTVANDRSTFTGALTGPGTEITTVTTTITPRSSSSKVLISIVLNYSCITNASQYVLFRITRNGTQIGNSIGAGQQAIASGSYEDGEVNAINNTKIEFLDSPATGSAVTYKVHIYSPLSPTNVYMNYAANGGTSFTTCSSMTLQEFFA